MKVNKITIIACATVIIISGIAICLVPNTESFAIIQNILTGVFTSSIVSCIIAVVNYFNERNCIIEKIDNNLKSLYINMSVLSQIIGNVSSHVNSAINLSSLAFKNISELSSFNVTFLNNMNLGLFSPFFKCGNLNRVCINLIEYQNIAYNIKNISYELQMYALEYDNQNLIYHNKQIMGIQINPTDNQNIANFKNSINIKVAKFHEYTTGKTIELEKNAEKFYSRKGSKHKWQEIKSSLMMQIEDIKSIIGK